MDLLSVIQQGGELLDKGTGGRALRGLVAGRPRELASIIPFSDSMGLTDPSESASGRDITNKWGLTDPNSSSLGSAAAGFGADMLLNPLNLIGGVGAFSRAPSVGRGLAAAAKSMSGVDALEGVGRGLASKAGDLEEALRSGKAAEFMADEAGALKMPDKWGPNPIKTEVRNSPWLSPEARSQNPHKMFSANEAKANYYKRSRQMRQNNPESLARQIARMSGPAGAAGGGLAGYLSSYALNGE